MKLNNECVHDFISSIECTRFWTGVQWEDGNDLTIEDNG